MSDQDRKQNGGWVKREDMIRKVFGNVPLTSDLENSFWYHLRKVKKTLGDCVACGGKGELIENRRVGRSESYYRLNPSIFSLTQRQEA